MWLEKRGFSLVHDRLALYFNQEIDWPIDFTPNINVQGCRLREALSYQDGWARRTYFLGPTFLKINVVVDWERTIGSEQSQETEFVRP